MTTNEQPSDPGMAELKDLLNASGCIVNVHHVRGEWMQVLLPSGKIVAIEKAESPPFAAHAARVDLRPYPGRDERS